MRGTYILPDGTFVNLLIVSADQPPHWGKWVTLSQATEYWLLMR